MRAFRIVKVGQVINYYLDYFSKRGECSTWMGGSRLYQLAIKKLKTKCKTNMQNSCELNVKWNCK